MKNTPSTFDVVIGNRWLDDVRHLVAHADEQDRFPFALEEVRAEVDIIVNEQNLSAELEAEPLFPLLDALCSALRRLSNGGKEILPLYEEPWELVFTRAGQLRFSMYALQPDGDVPAFEVEVDFAEVSKALQRCAEQIRTNLLSVWPGFEAHPLVQRLHQTIAPAKPVERPSEPALKLDFATDVGDLSVAIMMPLGLNHVLYDGENRLDAHALLGEGTLTLRSAGSGLDVELHIFPFLRAWLQVVRDAMLLDRNTEAGTLSIRVTEGEWMFCAQGTLVPSAPHDMVPLVLAAGEHFVQTLLHINPRQQENERLMDFWDGLQSLRAQLGYLGDGNVYGQERSMKSNTEASAAEQPEERFPGLRRLRLAPKWSLARKRISFADIRHHGEFHFIPWRGGICCLDRNDGLQWEFKVRRPHLLATHADGVLVEGAGAAFLIGPDGEATWRHRLSRGATSVAAHVCGSEFVHAYKDGRFVARAVDTGEVTWEVEALPSAPLESKQVDSLLLATAEGGFVVAVDCAERAQRWRIQLPDTGNLLMCTKDLVLLEFREPQKVPVLVALDLYSGREQWRQELAGVVSDITVFNDMVVVCEVGLHVHIRAVQDGNLAWRTRVEGQLMRCELLADPVREQVILLGNDRFLLGFDLTDGGRRWESDIRPNDPTPVHCGRLQLVSGGIFVPGMTTQVIDPSNGAFLLNLENIAHAPDYFRASEDLSFLVGEAHEGDTDELLAYRTAYFLELVYES